MKNLRQRGELALTLSLIGIFISLVGIGLGSSLTRNIQQSSSQAQTGSYPYRSVLEIRDENNQVIKWMPGLIWATTYDDKIAGRNNGDIKDKDGNAIIEWDTQDVPLQLQGTKAQISIGLPPGYRVVSSFCLSTPTSICANMKVEPDSLTYSGISVEKNGYIQYGIRITNQPAQTPTPTQQPTPTPTQRPTISPTGPIVTIIMEPTIALTITPTPTPTTTLTPTLTPTITPTPTIVTCPLKTDRCAPRNVKITEVKPDSVEVSWDKPADFATTCGGSTDNTSYWIDINNTGKAYHSGYTACTGESTDDTDTCKLGKEVFPHRILNQDSDEFKLKTWKEDQDYSAKVYLFNPKYSCVSPAGVNNFTYTAEEPKPDQICKVAGQDCTADYSEKCTADDGNPGLRTCHKVGSCSEPGDASKCSWDQSKGSTCTKCESTGPDDSCKYLGGNPNATERIVFLPVGFGSIEEFEQVVAPQVNAISITNLDPYKDRFNYSMYTKIGGDGTYGCRIGGTDDVSCLPNSKEAKNNSGICNGNVRAIVFPSAWKIYGGYSWKNSRGLVVNDKWLKGRNILFHEIGHALYGLDDEYSDDSLTRDLSESELNAYNSSINCSKLTNGTCKWGDRGKCIGGCGVIGKNLFRPSDNSIMNDDWNGKIDGNNYNLVSMDAIDKYFTQKFAFQIDEKNEPEYKNAIYVHISQYAVGTLNLESIESIPTYPDDIQQSLSDLTDAYYTLSVKDTSGRSIWQKQLQQYSQITDRDKGPELTANYYEYLPYFKTASSILITDAQGKTVLTVNLNEQNIAPPVPAGNLCGNSVCDAGNGETANSCRVDCGEHLIKSELERSDLDLNKQVNGVDMSILIDEAVYSKTSGGDIDGDGKTNALDYSILIKWLGGDY